MVRMFESGMWYDITELPVTKEKAEEIYNKQTYFQHAWIKQDEERYFKISEVFVEEEFKASLV